MIGAFFRWGMLAAGIIAALVAWQRWEAGTPPLWSMTAERAETVVTRAELSEEPAGEGRTREVAHIYVAWPPGSETSAEVPGLRSEHRRWHLHYARELTRAHPQGSPMTVRIVDGRPVADRIDLHDLAYALLATMFAVIFTVSGLALLVGRLRGGREEEEVSP